MADFATDDCIVAIATPAGRGGIGVVRISGGAALSISNEILQRSAPLEPRRATLTQVPAGAGVADEVVATYFKAPASYTGEDVVEISAHGSPVILHGIVTAALRAGARLAQPGEFTLRSFLNGKRDLVQSEAVADLINAATPLQARVAFDQLEGTLTRRISEIDGELFDLIARLEASLDFSDEGYHFIAPDEVGQAIGAVRTRVDVLLTDARRGRMIREGATVVIVGCPNVGKSSLFNALVGSERAIVTAVPGTTRDLITETVEMHGVALTLVDTAGWRRTDDVVEGEGVRRGERAREVGDLLLVVLDGSQPLRDDDLELLQATAARQRIVVLNKADLDVRADAEPDTAVAVSAQTSEGLDLLRNQVVSTLTGGEPSRDTAVVSNTRHIKLLEDVRRHLSAACDAAQGGGLPEEFVLSDLQAARAKLDEIVGTRTADDVLQRIFERFCIGK